MHICASWNEKNVQGRLLVYVNKCRRGASRAGGGVKHVISLEMLHSHKQAKSNPSCIPLILFGANLGLILSCAHAYAGTWASRFLSRQMFVGSACARNRKFRCWCEHACWNDAVPGFGDPVCAKAAQSGRMVLHTVSGMQVGTWWCKRLAIADLVIPDQKYVQSIAYSSFFLKIKVIGYIFHLQGMVFILIWRVIQLKLPKLSDFF